MHLMEVTVKQIGGLIPVESINVEASKISLYPKEEGYVTATVYPLNASRKSIIWSSSDTSIADVSIDGIVRGKKPGTVIITGTTKDGGFTDNCTITFEGGDTGITIPPLGEVLYQSDFANFENERSLWVDLSGDIDINADGMKINTGNWGTARLDKQFEGNYQIRYTQYIGDPYDWKEGQLRFGQGGNNYYVLQQSGSQWLDWLDGGREGCRFSLWNIKNEDWGDQNRIAHSYDIVNVPVGERVDFVINIFNDTLEVYREYKGYRENVYLNTNNGPVDGGITYLHSDYSSFRINNIVITRFIARTEWNPQNESTDWNDPNNWSNGLPNRNTNIYLSGEESSYPVLSEENENICNEIHFGYGSQLGRLDLLTYDKAYTEFDFNENKISPDRWYMLSMPIQGVISGDLAFARNPKVFLRKFDVSGTPSVENSFIEGTWSEYKTTNTEIFEPAEGFLMWVNGPDYGNDNLAAADNKFEIPYFANEDLRNLLNPSHSFNENTSRFLKLDNNGNPIEGTDETHVRSENAFKLYTEDLTPTIRFAGGLALVGNPYMSGLDFEALLATAANEGLIKNNYKIFDGYTIQSFSDISGSNIIAPIQSFIVEKYDDDVADEITLTFDISEITEGTEGALLRSSANQTDKLEIIASNPVASTKAFVANREGGSAEFGTLDSRKLILGISDIPEVYTVKDYNTDKIGVDINVIETDNILIPLALATSYEGEMTLAFNGMNNYNARIFLIDLVEEKETALEGASASYTFDFTPSTAGSKVVANEERFVIQILPVISGIDNLNTNEDILVYCKNRSIHIVSSSSNTIQQVFVYNVLGNLLYSEGNINATSYKIGINNIFVFVGYA